MKRLSVLALVIVAASSVVTAQGSIYQHGMVVRMHMGDCGAAHHGFIAVMGGAPAQPMAAEECPEYTLVTDKVVYVIVGKNSNQLIPLAEQIDFRFKENQLMVRVDDERRETKFTIKEMVLRPEWERIERMHQAMMSTRSAVGDPVDLETVDQRGR